MEAKVVQMYSKDRSVMHFPHTVPEAVIFSDGNNLAAHLENLDRNFARKLSDLTDVSVLGSVPSQNDTVLVRYANTYEWTPVRVGDLFNVGLLQSADVVTEDADGNTGLFLKFVFFTGDVKYADLTVLTASAISSLVARIEKIEQREEYYPEATLRNMYESGELDPDKNYYGYEE